MMIALNTQYSWSPATWALVLAGMVAFVLVLMLALIFMVQRAGEATAPKTAASTGDEREVTPESPASNVVRIPTQARSPEDARPAKAPAGRS